MKVGFVGSMPRRNYSGGRLLALGMAESLAMHGVEVMFFTNHYPAMMEEFKDNSRIVLKVVNFNDMRSNTYDEIDHLVIIPQQGRVDLHKKWVEFGKAIDAKIHLINFESANWFNSVSPFKRDESLWDGWVEVSKSCSSIISISEEGSKYAKEYYSNVPSDCIFTTIYPGINTNRADQVKGQQKKNQILFVTRIDPHKGYDVLEPFLTSELDGYTLLIAIGNGRFPLIDKFKWKSKLKKHGVKLKLVYKISSEEKFKYLKESKLLYFPTRFEGFGLPPLEAAYCNTATACSDLPVLREFGQNAFVYGDPESVESMREAIIKGLNAQENVVKEWPRIAEIARMSDWGERQIKFFESLNR